MRIRWHSRVASSVGARKDCLDPIGNQVLQRVDAVAHEEAKVGRNLLVPAASGVKLIPRCADLHSELLFYEVVNVFGFGIVEKRRVRLGAASDFSQRFHDLGKFFGGKHSGMFQCVRVSAAGGQFIG